jgi:hypothetical protein
VLSAKICAPVQLAIISTPKKARQVQDIKVGEILNNVYKKNKGFINPG